MPGLGLKSYLQLARETIYGQQPTYIGHPKVEIISENLTPQIGSIRDPSLSNSPSRRALYEAGKLYSGSIVVRGAYEGVLEMLRGVFGDYTPTELSAAKSYDHVFKNHATPSSYSLEMVVGDIPTGTCFRLSGAKFRSVTLRMTAGQGNDAMLQAEFGVVARDMQADQVLTTKCVSDRPSCAISTSTSLTHASSFLTYGARVGMIVSHATAIPVGTYITAISADGLTCTLSRACTNGNPLTIGFGPGSPSLQPVLFHQAIQYDDGSPAAGLGLWAIGVPGTIASGTDFTRSGGSNTTDGIVSGYMVTGAGLSTVAPTFVNVVTNATLLTLTPAATNGVTTLTFLNPLRIRSIEVTLENPLDEGRFYLGSPNVDEPVRSDFLSCRWRITQEFQSLSAFDSARLWPATVPSPNFQFQQPPLFFTTYHREFQISSGSAQFVEWSAPVESYGVIIATATLEAYLDSGTASTVVVRVRNGENSLP